MKRNRRLVAVTLLIVLLTPATAPSFAMGAAEIAIGGGEFSDWPQNGAGVQTEPPGEPAQPPPFDAGELPFYNVRATAVTPTRIDVEWDAPEPLWVLVEVWREGEKINSVNAAGGKASVIVAPEMSGVVTVSAEGYSESIECEIPAGRRYREYNYQKVESYTAYVRTRKKGFMISREKA